MESRTSSVTAPVDLSARALAVPRPGAVLERTIISRRPLRDDDVLIEIRYAGICHSDIHQANDDWDPGIYPMVPGHEIAGVVIATGPGVTRYVPGDRVGVGVYVDSCGHCDFCVAGEENFCPEAVLTYNSRDRDGTPTLGGYSRRIVVRDRFVLRLPDGLDLPATAPLLCAGITVYTPLAHLAAAGRSVGVVGLGGLGHVAVKIAGAMGADVTVLSRGEAKRGDALRLGAAAYHSTSDPGALRALEKRFDIVLNTTAARLDLDAYLKTLRVGGTLVALGLPAHADTFRATSIVSTRRSITGSNTGGLRDTQEMLDFCGRHAIGADVEVIGADEVAAAWGRVVRGEARYRVVIDAATF